jgi:hypothetical protein
VPNAAGSGAGQPITVVISSFVDQYNNGLLPIGNGSQDYSVQVTPSQPCAVSISGKTTSGFTVTLTPINSSTTLAAGTFDVTVVG